MLMDMTVAHLTTLVKPKDAHRDNDTVVHCGVSVAMAANAQIYPNRQPRRPHHIAEWAERRGLAQVDIARELGADKSLVSRWFKGTTPNIEYQERLASLFGTDPEGLFRHPDDDWLTRFLQGRTRDEVQRIKATLEAAFPRKTG